MSGPVPRVTATEDRLVLVQLERPRTVRSRPPTPRCRWNARAACDGGGLVTGSHTLERIVDPTPQSTPRRGTASVADASRMGRAELAPMASFDAHASTAIFVATAMRGRGEADADAAAPITRPDRRGTRGPVNTARRREQRAADQPSEVTDTLGRSRWLEFADDHSPATQRCWPAQDRPARGGRRRKFVVARGWLSGPPAQPPARTR